VIRTLACLILVLGTGCRLATPAFHCAADADCDGPSGTGRCLDGACAFASATSACASGFVFDRSAGALAGSCAPPSTTATDLGPAAPDLTPPATAPDLGAPPDLSPACMPGACTPPTPAGLPAVGACAGALTCGAAGPVCSARFDADFQTMAAPNGSWDWNCDGAVTVQTPQPANWTLSVPPTDAAAFCRSFTAANDSTGCCNGPATACGGHHWFSTVDPNVSPAACGETVTDVQCYWGMFGNNFGCHLGGTTQVTQACK
jgi:hypothetical protein